jgi:hypothetical protein
MAGDEDPLPHHLTYPWTFRRSGFDLRESTRGLGSDGPYFDGPGFDGPNLTGEDLIYEGPYGVRVLKVRV